MAVAQQYIEVGGDYADAIEIHEQSLELLPEHPGLAEALNWAREHQFLDHERFALAAEGMTFDEIREVLGPVNLHNIREYDERGLAAWFYPTNPAGGFAVMVFRDGVAIAADFDVLSEAEGEEWGEIGELPEGGP